MKNPHHSLMHFSFIYSPWSCTQGYLGFLLLPLIFVFYNSLNISWCVFIKGVFGMNNQCVKRKRKNVINCSYLSQTSYVFKSLLNLNISNTILKGSDCDRIRSTNFKIYRKTFCSLWYNLIIEADLMLLWCLWWFDLIFMIFNLLTTIIIKDYNFHYSQLF